MSTGQSVSKLAARGLKPISILASDREHGDRLRYLAGCRCDDCRRANCSYEKSRAQARKEGDWNGIVPADRARAHMLELSRQNVGRRAVQAATDIADSILHEIRSGERKNIRARTERLILAVTKEMASDHALVPAGPTWRLIRKLIEKGYTKRQLARRLGYAEALQTGKVQVTVRNAWEIRKLFEQCQASGFSDAKHRQRDESLPANTVRLKSGVLRHTMGE